MAGHFDMTRAPKAVTPPEALAIRYYCLGNKLSEAAHKCQMSVDKLRRVIASDSGQQEIAKIRAELDDEFLNLQSKVTKGLAEALDHSDVGVVLAASNQWLRAAKAKQVNVTITAEDLLKKVLDEAHQKKVQGKVIEPEFKEIPLQEMK